MRLVRYYPYFSNLFFCTSTPAFSAAFACECLRDSIIVGGIRADTWNELFWSCHHRGEHILLLGEHKTFRVKMWFIKFCDRRAARDVILTFRVVVCSAIRSLRLDGLPTFLFLGWWKHSCDNSRFNGSFLWLKVKNEIIFLLYYFRKRTYIIFILSRSWWHRSDILSLWNVAYTGLWPHLAELEIFLAPSTMILRGRWLSCLFSGLICKCLSRCATSKSTVTNLPRDLILVSTRAWITNWRLRNTLHIALILILWEHMLLIFVGVVLFGNPVSLNS